MDGVIRGKDAVGAERGRLSRGRRSVDEVQIPGPDDRLGAVADTELAVNVARVFLHGARRDHQLFCDLAISEPGGQQYEYLSLWFGQGLRQRIVRACR